MRFFSTRLPGSALVPALCALVFSVSAVGCRSASPAAIACAPIAPDPAAGMQLTRGPIAIIGDFGMDGPGEASVAALVRSWQPDFIVTTGDNNYPNGAHNTFEANIAKHFAPFVAFGSGYQGSFRAMGRSPNDQRFWPVLGNHDWRIAGASDYLEQFELPGKKRYYSVRRGKVAFFMVDSDRHEPDGAEPGSVQGLWLKSALAASDASTNIVVFHHPPYSIGAHGSATWMRWPFAAWGAHAVLCGHNHNYERRLVDGIPYVVNGIGGARLHPLRGACALIGTTEAKCESGLFGAMKATPRAEDDGTLDIVGMAADGTPFDHFTIPWGREAPGAASAGAHAMSK